MIQKAVLLGFFNKCLLKKTVSINDSSLSINDACYKYPDISQDVKLEQGLITVSLVWGSNSFTFFKTSPLISFLRSAIKNRLQYHRLAYKGIYDQCVTASVSFDNRLTTLERYARHSYWKALQNEFSETAQLLTNFDLFDTLKFDTSRISSGFKEFYEDPAGFFEAHNARWKSRELERYQSLFDNLESNPLTDLQRNACVIDEENTLVVAGAGTGKTSVMAAKAAYLVVKGLAKPEEILMLAYGSDARVELTERVHRVPGLKSVDISTFHSLGLKLIQLYEKKSADVTVLATDDATYTKFIDNQISVFVNDVGNSEIFKTYIGKYLYPQKNHLDFKTDGEYLKHLKDNDIRALSGDLVKSFEELAICNYLFLKGIEFEYEPTYRYDVSKPGSTVYKPDFYIPKLDVYIEHFGIDKEGNTRHDINKEQYNADRQWKIEIHNKHDTHLIQTFSWQSKPGLELHLEKALVKHCEIIEVDFESITSERHSSEIFATLKDLGAYKGFSKLIASFLALYKASIVDMDSLNLSENDNTDGNDYTQQRWHFFKAIFKWILARYESVLEANGTLDFSDMINKAADYCNNEDFHHRTDSIFHYKYILVDEFQDISPIRANLVSNLKRINPGCALFCVGDDWQAIYRFTGSDLRLTTEFSQNFGYTERVFLDKTFRFNNMIEKVASGFVQKNPNQLKKHLDTHSKSKNAEVCLMLKPKSEALDQALQSIHEVAGEKSVSVMILSRFKASLPELAPFKARYPSFTISAMSAHTSKGKQADFVIILDVNDGRFGFPSMIETDSILGALLPKLDGFLHSEERRLFYVALSRAKKTVYVHAELGKESVFFDELKSNSDGVRLFLDDLSTFYYREARCFECNEGRLIPQEGRYGVFFRCSLGKDYCDTTVKMCATCNASPVSRNEHNHYCVSPDCDYRAEVCPNCQVGALVERPNRKKGNTFWGCSGFHSKNSESCRYSRSIIKSAAVKSK